MRLVPVSLCLFHRVEGSVLSVWVQTREDDGPYHGMLEFPGGGVEAHEVPIEACVREVEEEVGLRIDASTLESFGTYSNEVNEKTILLYVFLSPPDPFLETKGEWLRIEDALASEKFRGRIPPLNHRMIEDLYRAKVFSKQV